MAFGLWGIVVGWCLLNAWILGNLSLLGYDTLRYAGTFLLAAAIVALWAHLRER
jgi:hypothetical protein